MSQTRRAHVVWEGDLLKGTGRVNASTSGAFRDLAVSWPARVEAAGARTSPEELLAAAHASCFAMALSFGLANAGTPPQRLEVSASVTIDQVEGGYAVTSSAIEVRGTVPGCEAAAFQKAAEGAKDGCPISKALKNNVQMTVTASLA